MTDSKAGTLPYHPFDLTRFGPQVAHSSSGVLEPNRNPRITAPRSSSRLQPGYVVPASASPGQDAAGAPLLLRRRAALRWVSTTTSPGQQGPLPLPQLPPGRGHARGRQPRLHLAYEPNSYGEWQQQPDTPNALALDGAAAHWNFREDDNTTTPSRQALPAMSPEQQRPVRQHGPARATRPTRSRSATSASASRPTRLRPAWQRPWASTSAEFPINQRRTTPRGPLIRAAPVTISGPAVIPPRPRIDVLDRDCFKPLRVRLPTTQSFHERIHCSLTRPAASQTSHLRLGPDHLPRRHLVQTSPRPGSCTG
jgi:hypothetical protein